MESRKLGIYKRLLNYFTRSDRSIDWVSLGFGVIAISLLTVFILIPIFSVIIGAFVSPTGQIGFENFVNYWNVSSWRRGLLNSLFCGVMTLLITSMIGIPVAYVMSRFRFFGRGLFQLLTIIPLMMPPFVGAYAMTTMLGRNGILTNFLRWFFYTLFQYDIGLTGGLLPNNIYGIILIQVTHLWPLIYLNTSAALSKIDPTLEESAKNLGASNFSLFSKITFPLSLPGYAAGALLVFLWSISDLGTPIMLGVHEYAPFQAFKQLREIGGDVEAANVISVIITVISMLALYGVNRFVGLKEYATIRAGAEPRRIVKKAGKVLTIGIVIGLSALICVSVLPHIGTVLIAFTKRPAYGDWVPQGVTFEHMMTVLGQQSTTFSVLNSLYYSLVSAFIDIFLGAAIAYLLVRKNFVGKSLLDMISMLPFAIPGVVIGLGYIRLFSRPIIGTFRLTSIWFILVISYSMRRLPYAVRASYAVLKQVHITLEEAAQNLGASKIQTFSRIIIPLMMPGLVAGGIMSFTSAFTEVSTSLMLQPIVGPFGLNAKPITLTIYFAAMRGAASMGIAGCLGFIQIIATSFGLYLTNKLLGGRAGLAFGA